MFSAGPASEATSFEQPWLEKYRPQQIKDIVGNEETVGRLEVLAKQGNMPNLILSGPPGTGKTTSVLALARTLLGDAFKEGVLELYLSVKIRSDEEIDNYNEEFFKDEKRQLRSVDGFTLIDYIKSSIEVLMNMKVEE